ncbi:MAG: hypothetical protein QM578_13795 [Pantoea sp.]|uniref:lysozyme inhibitor LprI family protein n=1 Tax=Pantoea sp. TaxID=69393 RepID=UPI0039E63823
MMKKRNVIFIAVGILWHMPVYAASFDCKKASSYAELTICSTPSLSSLDDKLNALYRKALTEKADQATMIKKSQLLWLKSIRNKATTVSQLDSAYNGRINDLVAVLGVLPEQKTAESAAPSVRQVNPASPPAPTNLQQAVQDDGGAPPSFPSHTDPVTKVCKVSMQYGRGFKDKYLSGKKNDPYTIKVTDSGDSFVIHFDQNYGLGDMDSGEISALGQEYLNIKKESDGSTSYYTRPANAKFSSYRLKSTSNNETQLQVILYACNVAAAS